MKLVIAVFLLVCAVSAQADTVVDVLKSLGTEATLLGLVQMSGLDTVLQGKGPFTVFAPTDTSFANLPNDLLHKLESNTTLLTQILQFHVVSGAVKSTDLKNNQLIQSLAGPNIRVNIYNTHQPAVITVDGILVTKPDNVADNGVVHVVGHVLYPVPTGNIVEEATTHAHLTTLASAVSKAGLVATLSGTGPFTVFAPTNEAFAKLPAGVLDGLLKNVTALTDVLTYHVVPGVYYVPGLSDGETLKTVEGKNVTIKLSPTGPMVNNATITVPLTGTNGVLLIIDTVLLPPSMRFELVYNKK